jgi:hypothetical protein
MLKLSYFYRTSSRFLAQGVLGVALALGAGHAQAQSLADITVAELSTVPKPGFRST